MQGPFQSVRFFVSEKSVDELQAAGIPASSARGFDDTDAPSFTTDEEAARFYLGCVLKTDERPGVRGFAESDPASPTGEARLHSVEQASLSNTSLVRFEQTASAIPIFGSRMIVELDPQRRLVDITGDIASIGDISPSPTLTPGEALDRVAAFVEWGGPAPLTAEAPAELTFFFNEGDQRFHLAHHFRNIPAAPREVVEEPEQGGRHGHRLGRSPRDLSPLVNYLVDAHDGSILFYYSVAPTSGPADLIMPSKCRGRDERGDSHEFFGLLVAEGGFELHDPIRKIQTFDLGAKDVDARPSPMPSSPVRHTAADFGETNRAAVSAHVNAGRVQDFFRSVLMRDSIDGKGMTLISVVNCTCKGEQPPPEWNNATWWKGRMWYGQRKDTTGRLTSLSVHLDIIAHELTHGITEHTSNLVYQGQSGALNESYSDIFGVIVANWYTAGPDSDAAKWTFRIGAGLGDDGRPLRDFSAPKETGDPDHMDDYLRTKRDFGGVHTNSNIHNKAAYNVLTAVGEGGERVFTPRDVAMLYYLALIRMPPLATFSKSLSALLDAASVFYAGDAADKERKLKSITDAYALVGILA